MPPAGFEWGFDTSIGKVPDEPKAAKPKAAAAAPATDAEPAAPAENGSKVVDFLKNPANFKTKDVSAAAGEETAKPKAKKGKKKKSKKK